MVKVLTRTGIITDPWIQSIASILDNTIYRIVWQPQMVVTCCWWCRLEDSSILKRSKIAVFCQNSGPNWHRNSHRHPICCFHSPSQGKFDDLEPSDGCQLFSGTPEVDFGVKFQKSTSADQKCCVTEFLSVRLNLSMTS